MNFSYVRAPIDITFDGDINFSGGGGGVVYIKKKEAKASRVAAATHHHRDVIALFDEDLIVSGD